MTDCSHFYSQNTLAFFVCQSLFPREITSKFPLLFLSKSMIFSVFHQNCKTKSDRITK